MSLKVCTPTASGERGRMREFIVGRIGLACISISMAAAGAAAQTSKQIVDARAVLATEAAHTGSSVKAAVVAQVTPGFHINDHQPTLDYLIPTELKFEPSGLLAVDKIVYPKGEPQKFTFSDTPLSVYEGTIALGAVLTVAQTATPGTYSLKGKLSYQACNDHACLPPASVPVSLSIKVVPRNVPLKRVNADVFNKIQFD